MGSIEERALIFLARPRSCTELGEHLWGTKGRVPQSYARPAGKLIARLVARFLVDHDIEATEARGGPKLWVTAIENPFAAD